MGCSGLQRLDTPRIERGRRACYNVCTGCVNIVEVEVTKNERKIFIKLREFACIVRNRAPIGPLRADGVAMTELIDDILIPAKRRRRVVEQSRIIRGIAHRWETE